MAKDYEIRPDQEAIYGKMLADGKLPEIPDDPMLQFYSDDDGAFYMDQQMLSKHILLIGGIGSGKTNTFYHIVRNLDLIMHSEDGPRNDVMLLFDTKGDFYEKFYTRGEDVVIGNSAAFSGETKYWNLFREIEYGGKTREEKELTAREIAKTLFEQRKNGSQPFFSNAAADLFFILVTAKMREFWGMPEYHALEEEMDALMRTQGDHSEEIERIIRRQRAIFDREAPSYNNRVLIRDIIRRYTVKDILNVIRSWPDFASAESYIGNGTSNQALGVLGELNSMINDYFIGIFADYQPGRDISMRELIHNKDGKKIFIEYDLSVGEVLTCIYSLLIDLSLKEALGRSHAEGNVYLIIDEFKLLPKLHHIDDALNFGRSLGIKVAAGIQNIRQLEDVYGETRGQVIAAGFSNIFAFRMTDEPSRTYVSELFGKNFVSLQYWDMAGELKRLEREGHTVEDWQLVELGIGQAVVGLTGCAPFLFQFEEY
ncbi:MAG: type IV secretion system DNA-binding domain-containing protein [Clostridiales bacterium]|nr:type IV secretion system DNA-binding domain-containing protein [Clostridiales bacterium]